MRRQSRRMSMIETAVNYSIGFVLAWLLSYYLLPAWGLTQSVTTSTTVTLIFTGVSIIRSYFIRRVFEFLR